ncbi:uncharacterized protein METZ01_LOCUS154364, partial [marine metagenome]
TLNNLEKEDNNIVVISAEIRRMESVPLLVKIKISPKDDIIPLIIQ